MSTLVLALTAGAVVGVSLGALGGGGSVLAVPALIYLLGFTPQAATTASLLIVAVISVNGLVAYARARRVRWRTGALFAAAGLPAAATAGALSARIPPPLLTAGFAALAAFAAWRMLATRTPSPDPVTAPSPARATAVGAGLGAVTGLLGVGGGFLVVPALITVLRLSMSTAVGTSLLVIAANSAAALVPRLGSSTGVDWAVIAPFAATAILGSWDGKRLADRLSGRVLQRAFAVVLLAVAVFMLADAWW